MSRKRLLSCCSALILGLLLPVLVACPASARPAKHVPKRDAKQQVEALEQQWRSATLGADVGTMDTLLSEDYVGISWTGQVVTKSAQLERLRSRSLAISRMDMTDMKVKVVGTVAIVTSRAELQGTNEGQEMRGTFLYTRIYQRAGNGTWKITNFESVRVPSKGSGRRVNRFMPTS